MRFPYKQFTLKWNLLYDEPYCEQVSYENYSITWNPDDRRFYVARRNKESPDNWDTLGTYKETPKGFENAVQRMKREIRAEHL